MASRRPPGLVAFDAPVAPPDERTAAGKARRAQVPRTAHAVWDPHPHRLDPVEVLVESNRTRDQSLVPLRYERMASSPFAFLRGSAAVMALDLANGPSSALSVQLCGDAHVGNFGMFASPERRLVFDLNDFDETAQGPFEWDVKRLAASLAVAAAELGFDRLAARRAVLTAVSSYRDWTERFAAMTHLEVWYARIEVSDLLAGMASSTRKVATRQVQRMSAKNHFRAQERLTTMVDGRRRIVDSPPLVEHVDHVVPDLQLRLIELLSRYRSTLQADRAALFDRYRFVDFARKVVGVGSVGTRCWIALFQGPNGGPLFLQVKEANRSVVDVALGRRSGPHHGRRVVEGQRLLQATSDVLLGWSTDQATGVHYYVRQLWDSKGSIDLEQLGRTGLATLGGYCGWALARAHARTGDAAAVAGYLGSSERFGEVIADWAEAYAQQTVSDHAALCAAVDSGLLPVRQG